MSSFAEVARIRRQQVVNLSITELMILLVFMAITYSFLAHEEDRKDIPFPEKELIELRAANERLKTEIRKAQQERDVALAKIVELEQRLRQLFPDAPPPVPNPGGDSFVAVTKSALAELQARAAKANELQKRVDELEKQEMMSKKDGTVAIPSSTLDELRAQAAKAKELQAHVDQLLKQIQELQKNSPNPTGKAPGLPLCTLSKSFLLAITLKANGTFAGTPAWDPKAASQISVLPGVQLLSSGQPISETEFRNSSTLLFRWGELQPQPCRFSVRVRRESMSAEQFERQLELVERFYYVRRGR